MPPSDLLPPPPGSWLSRKLSVVAQLTVLVAATLAVLLGIIFAAVYFEGRELVEAQIDARLSAVAESRRDYVAEWIGRQHDRVDIFATRGVLRNFLEKHAAKQPEEPQRGQSQENLEGHVSIGAALVASITDREGVVLLSSDSAEVGRNRAGDALFQAGLEGPSVGWPEPAGDGFTVEIAAPTRWIDGTRAALGVVVLKVDASPLAVALRNTTGLGQTGEVVLVIREGDQIRLLFPLRHSGQRDSLPAALVPAIDAATTGQSSFLHTTDYRGIPVLAAARPIGYGGWGLVVKMDEHEAYAPIDTAQRAALVLAAAISLIGLIGAYSVARGFTRPIRRLGRAAESVANGDLNVAVPVRSSNELGVLSAAFNEMIAALRARIGERERAEAALDAERARLRTLIDVLPFSIYVKDTQHRFLVANVECARAIGAAAPAELLGKTDADFFPEALAAAALENERPVLAGEPVFDLEHESIRPGGSVIIELTTKVPLRDAAGNVIGLVGVSRDITGRRRADEALRASEALLRSITDHTEDIIFVKDRQSRTIFKNPAGLRADALPPEKVIGHTDTQFVADSEQAARFLAADRRVMESGRTETVEEVLTSATGEEHVLLTTKTPRFDADGNVIGLVGVARDITARKAAEQALRESNERYELVVTGAHAAIWDWNIVARRVYYSPRWKQVRGYTDDEISDREEEWSERIHADDRDHVIAALRAHIEGRAPLFSEEYRILCKDGSWKWVLDRGLALRNSAGHPIRMAGSETDITERKRAEEEIKASLAEKEVLLSEVHHRVKNNLQIVSSLLNLQTRQLTDPALIEVFSSTRDRVAAMAAVHERLYESGDFARIDLGAHLGSLARVLMRAHSPAGARVRPVLRLDPVPVDLNTAVPLSLIANELILNALKYAFAGRQDGELTLELHTSAGYRELRVADDGPGFPATLDPATTTTLGLRLVRDLARQIRAELRIDSSTSGTNVVLRWPEQLAANERATPADVTGAPET